MFSLVFPEAAITLVSIKLTVWRELWRRNYRNTWNCLSRCVIGSRAMKTFCSVEKRKISALRLLWFFVISYLHMKKTCIRIGGSRMKRDRRSALRTKLQAQRNNTMKIRRASENTFPVIFFFLFCCQGGGMWIVKVTLAGYQHPLSSLYATMIMMMMVTVLLLRVLLLEKVRIHHFSWSKQSQRTNKIIKIDVLNRLQNLIYITLPFSSTLKTRITLM